MRQIIMVLDIIKPQSFETFNEGQPGSVRGQRP
jgi:hypothetical protein